jgi:hypothetical protein
MLNAYHGRRVSSLSQSTPSGAIWNQTCWMWGKSKRIWAPVLPVGGTIIISLTGIDSAHTSSFVLICNSNRYDLAFIQLKENTETSPDFYVSWWESCSIPFTVDRLLIALEWSCSASLVPDNIHNSMLSHLSPVFSCPCFIKCGRKICFPLGEKQ